MGTASRNATRHIHIRVLLVAKHSLTHTALSRVYTMLKHPTTSISMLACSPRAILPPSPHA